jgi:hypothetical protein
MKKSFIAMALMFGAVVFVMSSCGGKKNEDPEPAKTYNCTCSNTSFSQAGTGLTEDQKNAYVTACQSSTTASSKGGATPKEAPKAECN